MSIPNFITVFRIFLVPLVVWFMLDGRMQTAFLLFLTAGISDGIDGFLAKRYALQTELGAYLDPLADKALLVSIYAVLGFFGHLPVWLVIAVISRDILIVGALMLAWMLARPMAVRPLMISKANTVGQIVLAAMVLGDLGFGLGLENVVAIVIWISGGLTILSAVAYLLNWVRHMASYEEPRQPVRKPARNRNRSRAASLRGKEPVTGS